MAKESSNDIKSELPEYTSKVMSLGINHLEKAQFNPDGSTRSQELEEQSDSFFSNKIITPPINFASWAAMLELNTRVNRTIQLRARNVAGLGWVVQPKVHFNEETPTSVRKQIEKDIASVKKLLDCPNNETPLTTLLFLYKLDVETTGNGYLEVVRNGVGIITQINHVPSIAVKILKRNRGYVQVAGNKKVFYKKFRDERVMDFTSGSFAITRNIPFEKRATELLHFKLATASRSTAYGLPRWISTAKAIAGNDLSAKRNVLFFENDAVPRMAIIVENGSLSSTSVQAIEDFLANCKGVENAGRVMVIQAELNKKLGGSGSDSARIKLEPLTVGLKEDASFLDYRVANDEEIREAFGIAEVYFKMKDVNRGSAEVGRQTTNEQEFEPDRIELEFFLNHTLVKAILGKNPADEIDIEFKLKRPEISNPVDRVRMDTLLSGEGILAINEIRERHGLQRFPANFEFGNMPFPVAMNLLRGGISTGIRDLSFPEVPTSGGNGGDGRPESPENAGGSTPRDKKLQTNAPSARDAAATSKKPKKPQTKKTLDLGTSNQIQLLKETIADLERRNRILLLGDEEEDPDSQE